MKISVIVTNWNGVRLGYLEPCLDSIEKEFNRTDIIDEVIIVDDCSSDESERFILVNYPQFKIIRTPKNLGFQAAANYGVYYATNEVVMILNNDIIVTIGVSEKFINWFKKDDNVFAVSTRVHLWDGVTYLAGKRIAHIEKGNFILKDCIDEKDKTALTLFATGGAACFNREKFFKLEGFDRLYYPLYWEDIDICYRAQKRGWKVIYDPQILLLHKHQATIQTMYGKDSLRLLTARNSYLFFWKNITDSTLIREHIFYNLLLIIKDIFMLKFRFPVASILALQRIIEVIKRRKIELRESTKTDTEVLSNHSERAKKLW
ncbi:MAG: glycosyltransferase family 2 protein [Candidatus Hydrogenedentota bacterium]